MVTTVKWFKPSVEIEKISLSAYETLPHNKAKLNIFLVHIIEVTVCSRKNFLEIVSGTFLSYSSIRK